MATNGMMMSFCSNFLIHIEVKVVKKRRMIILIVIMATVIRSRTRSILIKEGKN